MQSRREFIKKSAGIAALVAGRTLCMTPTAIAFEKSSAKAAGFRAPLESDPHELTFMQWPSRASIYGGKGEL